MPAATKSGHELQEEATKLYGGSSCWARAAWHGHRKVPQAGTVLPESLRA